MPDTDFKKNTFPLLLDSYLSVFLECNKSRKTALHLYYAQWVQIRSDSKRTFFLKQLHSYQEIIIQLFSYRKVENSSLFWLVTHFQIFRRLMKGKFDAYVL